MTLALLITAATGAWAADYYVVGNFTNWSTNPAYKMTLNTECTSTTEYILTLDLAADAQFKVVKVDGQDQTWYPDGMGNNYGENGELKGAGKYTVYFRPNTDGNQDWFYGVINVAAAESAPASIITVNDAKTEASFEMPQYDVTATYTIKRDISVDVTAQVGDGTQEQPRYRVKKDGNKFIPADMEMAAVPALFTVNDAIEQKALTQTQDYIVQIYAIDAEGQPTGNPMTFANFTFEPGIYAVRAVAADGSDYAGETALSNTFKLFLGYELKVAPRNYATYYKDEPLTTANENAELYTIASINGSKAVLSEQMQSVPKNTPFLIYNNHQTDTVTFVLSPVEGGQLSLIQYAPEFKGTLNDSIMPASSEGTKYYICNGYDFVWVRNAGTIAANRCWLEISNSNARALNIVFGDLTEVKEVKEVIEVKDDSFYDLNGRKLNGMPTKKGVYILNGKKTVIK